MVYESFGIEITYTEIIFHPRLASGYAHIVGVSESMVLEIIVEPVGVRILIIVCRSPAVTGGIDAYSRIFIRIRCRSKTTQPLHGGVRKQDLLSGVDPHLICIARKLNGRHHLRHVHRRAESECSSVGHARITRSSALCGHKHHSVCGPRSINSRSRGILQYRYALHIGRIDIGKALLYSVNKDIGLTSVDRACSPYVETYGRTRLATHTARIGIGYEAKTSHISLKSACKVSHRTRSHCLRLHSRNSSRDGVPLLGSHSDDHGLFKKE